MEGESTISNSMWLRGWDERIKPGKYTIDDKITMGETAEMLATGRRVDVKVIVPSHREIDVVAGKIASYTAADSSEVLELIKQDSVRWKIIPNTYNMWWETDAEGAVERLLKESDLWWTEHRMAKADMQGLTIEEAVILASIVQSETNDLSEAPTVAGLYLNRLRKGQLLQADPTVVYALGDYTVRRVLKEHLEIESPYNTYLNKGLPPGTIMTPEPSFIESVLNAEEHDYLYMCAEPGGTNKHVFAKRYRDHVRNARRFQKWLNSQNIYK